MIDLYKKVDAHPAVKKAFVGSGIRYDLLTKDYNKHGDASLEAYMEQVISRHVFWTPESCARTHFRCHAEDHAQTILQAFSQL